jgi:hypothetical protein
LFDLAVGAMMLSTVVAALRTRLGSPEMPVGV